MRFYTLFLLLFFFCACEQKSPEKSEIIRSIKYAEIGKTAGKESYSLSGSVVAENEADLSFKVSGLLSTVNVKLGDKVRKGQLLATIDPADYTIQSNQAISQKEGAIASQQSAEANAKAAESQLINAQATYDRVARLYGNNSVSLSEYQQAKAGLDAAKAQYDAAQSEARAANTQVATSEQQLRTANNQVAYTRLTAPSSGVITKIAVEANEMVNVGSPIVTVSSLERLEVEVGVPETLIAKLKKGQQASIQLPSISGQIFAAEVTEISFVSGQSTTYPVRLKIKDPNSGILPGMAAKFHMQVDSSSEELSNQIVAPLKSVASGVDGNYVFTLVQDEEEGIYIAQKVPVKLGDITNQSYIIQEGLNAGDLVAIAGLKSLYDGKRVTLLKH